MPPVDVQVVKRNSEAIIPKHRGLICDWLPSPELETTPRDSAAAARRALALNAVVQLAFQAPHEAIREWLAANGLERDLSASERVMLARQSGTLSEQELADLCWRIEALWALAWAGSLTRDLPLDRPVSSGLASRCPNIQRGKDATRFLQQFTLRPYADLYQMLDLYCRAHWWTVEARLRGERTGKVSGDVVMERRKALEWVLDADTDWDDVDLST